MAQRDTGTYLVVTLKNCMPKILIKNFNPVSLSVHSILVIYHFGTTTTTVDYCVDLYNDPELFLLLRLTLYK